ncbi:MAG: TRAP transporter substrate-binding protein [Deltaproteobacteria bacterium]|nr:TRAP transporter substrate-binding protein [Deltaproteobacteria bacterium]MBW2154846.1 TRAP transporter substrate-binding protein [Deltaproteobacteria bacterium]
MIALTCFVLTGTTVWAGPVVLKFGWTTAEGKTDPYAIIARQFKKALEEIAPGQFEVQLFPNRQLGDEKEMLEGLSFGTLDSAVITNSPISRIAKSFQVNDMPFIYASEEQAHKVLDGPIGQKLMKSLEKQNIIGLGFAEGGYRQMINNVRQIYMPKDVSGIKWRVMPNPVYIGMFRSLGGNAVPMAWGEVFTAMQQKTIDGLEIPIAVIYSNHYYEVAKYLSITNHTYSALGLLISKRKYDRLTPDQQDAVKKAARKAIAIQRQMNKENIEILIGKIKEKGMRVNAVRDPSSFRSKVKPVYEKFRDSIGSELLDSVLAAVKQ